VLDPTSIASQPTNHIPVDLLSIYLEVNYLKIYLEFFEFEILFQDLTHMFTLTNKNRRKTKLNENKISY
jgi:hypothetical protein